MGTGTLTESTGLTFDRCSERQLDGRSRRIIQSWRKVGVGREGDDRAKTVTS